MVRFILPALSVLLLASNTESITPAITLASPTQVQNSIIPLSRPNETYKLEGRVGKLPATFTLTANARDEVRGTYGYKKRPGVTYKMAGNIGADGNLYLKEYTNGKLTARCDLKVVDDCYQGKMYNMDGRAFNMSICNTLAEDHLHFAF